MRFHYFFSLIVMFYGQSRFRYDIVSDIRGNRLNSTGIAQEFNNIRTCCTKVKESITNQLRICRMQHELGTN